MVGQFAASVRAAILRLVAYAGIGQSGLYGAASRIWSVLAGPVTLAVVASALSPEMQGYYFAFSGVLALQVFAEMGLGNVVVPIVSHEWAALRLENDGSVAGQPDAVSRLASLVRFVAVWYSVAGVLVAAVLAAAGYWFFLSSANHAVGWKGPWLALCATAGAALAMQGVLYLLEGCHQLDAVYKCNFISGVLSAVGIWLALLLGFGLWSVVIPGLARAATASIIGVAGYLRFWCDMLGHRGQARIDWRNEVWPFQWRIGVSWLAGYFINSLANPVVFRYEGAAVAGQLGMSLALAATVPWIGYALIKPETATFGAIIARGDYASLDERFRRVTVVALSMAMVLSLCVMAGVFALSHSGSHYAQRLLPPFETGLLLLTAVLRTILQLQSTYLRSHRQEPLMMASILAGLLGAVVAVQFTRTFGATGMVVGYLLVTLLFELPVSTSIFVTKRQEWRVARRFAC